MTRQYEGTEIAIIGMAGRFPGADDIDQFWEMLREGKSGLRWVESAETDPDFIPVASAISDYDKFDAAYFDYSPRDAEITDPQQRVFLETCVHALEHAGYDPAQHDHLFGVYAGGTTSNYLIYNLARAGDQLRHVDAGELDIGNGADFLATRVSYKLNLRGGSFSVQTACSTSLVAVHLACQALLNDECDISLAGGVSIHVDHAHGYRFVEGSIMSPNGDCRAYDAAAAGTVFGSGAGVVVLKRLEDALEDGDHVHAIILGSAINNDGSDKVGYPAPGVAGQAAVIAEALAVSGVPVETIQYNEGHGSGTALGDPIEVLATTRAYRSFSQAVQWGWLGSVKSNVGHLTGAAGIAGLLKTVLSIENAQIPPTLGFEQPNPTIDFAQSPFYPNTELRAWETDGASPRRAGVSSFGLGGTNAHLILEQAPAVTPSDATDEAVLLPVSAKSAETLQTATHQLQQHLANHPNQSLADVGWTLQIGRTAHPHRRIVRADSHAAAVVEFDSADSCISLRPPAVAYVLDGEIDRQHVAQCYDRYPVFQETLDDCCAHFSGLLDALQNADAPLSPHLHEAANFALAVAYAELWQAFEIAPETIVAAGKQQLAAAVIAGALSQEAAIGYLKGMTTLALLDWQTPSVPLISAETATYVNPAHDASYLTTASPNWDGVNDLLTSDAQRVILQLAKRSFATYDTINGTDVQAATAALWLAGAQPDWTQLHGDARRQRVVLPQYPFDRKRYWIEPQETPATTRDELKKQPDFADWFYQHGWQSVATSGTPAQPAQSWLVLGNDADEIAALLPNATAQPFSFVTPPASLPTADHVVLVLPAQPIVASELLFSVVQLARTLDGATTRLDIVSRAALALTAHDVVQPAHAALLGAVQVIAQEMPHLRCRLIDRNDDCTPADIVAACQSSSASKWLALRFGQLWQRTQLAAPLAEPSESAFEFRPNQTHVVIGGGSGIGRDIAVYLANRTRVAVIHHGDCAPIDDCLMLPADLLDTAQMQAAFATIHAQLGDIDGIIHTPTESSGSAFRPISDITRPAIEATFALKCFSLHTLPELVAQYQPDFCLVSSALSTALGGVGLTTLSAAAHYAEAFVAAQTGATRWLSIGWDVWQLGGDPAQLAMLGDLAPLALTPQEAGAALERALATSSAPNLLLSTAPLDQRRRQQTTPTESDDRTLYERPDLFNDYVAPTGETEQKVVEIWEQVLGIRPIGVHDNFFDLGGHSLLATQLRNHLHSEFRVNLPLQQLFDDATAAGISSVIDKQLGDGEGSDRPIAERLQAAFPTERAPLLHDYLHDKLAASLNRERVDDDLSQYDRQLAVVDLMWHLKNDLRVQFYPHEIMGRDDLGELSNFVLGQYDRQRNLRNLATVQPLTSYQLKQHADADKRQFAPPPRKNEPMVFVLSSPRAGSTLFRVMLAGHPDIFCPPEISLLFFENMQQWQQNVSFGQDFQWPAEGLHWALVEALGIEPEEGWAMIDQLVADNRSVQAVYKLLQDNADGRLLVDKTPPYAMDKAALQHAERIFDGAKFIHLVRHPYAMIESFLRVRLDQQFSSSLFEEEYPDPYIIAETIWATANRNLVEFSAEIPPTQWLQLRYEDLVTAPETQMQRVCDFLGIPFDKRVVTPYDGRRERMMGGIGDPNILNHSGIDPKLAAAWQKARLPRPLDPTTAALAHQFGYELPHHPDMLTLDPTDVDALSDAEVEAMLAALGQPL